MYLRPIQIFYLLNHPEKARGATPQKMLVSVFSALNLRQRRDVGRSPSHHGCEVLQLIVIYAQKMEESGYLRDVGEYLREYKVLKPKILGLVS